MKRKKSKIIIFSIVWKMRDLELYSIKSLSENIDLNWKSTKYYLELLETICVVSKFGKKYRLSRNIKDNMVIKGASLF